MHELIVRANPNSVFKNDELGDVLWAKNPNRITNFICERSTLSACAGPESLLSLCRGC